MRLRTIAAVSGVAAVVGLWALPVAHAADLGEFALGASIDLPFTGCTPEGTADNNIITVSLDGNIVYTSFTVPDDPGLFNWYTISTTGYELGDYLAVIDCAASIDPDFTHTFTIVAADPCAPEVTVQIPDGPSRAPHAAEECEDIGAMGTPRTASTTLLIGAVALAVGSGLLVIRRQRLA
jgi:hypothetical protein